MLIGNEGADHANGDSFDDTVLWRFDGTSWSEIGRAQTPFGSTWATPMTASADDDIFAAANGLLIHWDGQSLTYPNLGISCWGTNQAVGIPHLVCNGAVLRQTSDGWDHLLTGDQSATAVAVYSDDSMLTVGNAGDSGLMTTMARYDVGFPEPPPDQFYTFGATWALDRRTVFGLVSLTEVAYYDGLSWSIYDTGRRMGDIWGSAPDDVYVVGVNGISHHYDGEKWTEQPTLVDSIANLGFIDGTDASNIFVMSSGKMAYFDGNTWTTLEAPYIGAVSVSVEDMMALPGKRLWVATTKGTLWYYDGSTWDTSHQIAPGSDTDVYATEDWVLGASRYGMYRYDGTTWTEEVGLPTGLNWESLGGTSGTDVYASTNNGVLYHYDGTSWERRRMPESPSNVHVATDSTVFTSYGGMSVVGPP
jgi:hypothetical protein